MPNPMVMKLEYGAQLSDHDRARLGEISQATENVGARQDLVAAGETPRFVNVILDGFAYRYKSLADGRRAIVAHLLPGDFCDLHATILGRMDHSITTVSPCTIVRIPHDTVIEVAELYPHIRCALWWATLVDESILREWLVNLGGRPSDQRLAHLLCELYWRLRAVGFVKAGGFKLPLTQEELGETLGITGVHVNRVMQKLREDGLIRRHNRQLSVPDIARLEKFAGFDPTYLHLTCDFALRQEPACN